MASVKFSKITYLLFLVLFAKSMMCLAQKEGILQSAYMNDDEIVVVLVNQFENSKEIKITGIPKGFKSIEIYQTTENPDINLKRVSTVGVKDVMTLPKKSLTACLLKK